MTVELLREFLESDGIKGYDSSLCWGCGEQKSGACDPDCLLERTRKFLAEEPENGCCFTANRHLSARSVGVDENV